MSNTRSILFHKPFGVLTSFTDPEGRPTLADYIDVADVYAAGRLDYDSEGLMLLTSDGSLAHRLTEPRYKLPKTYYVQVEGDVSDEMLDHLRQGVVIKGERTRPAQAEEIPDPGFTERSKPITPHGPTHWLKIVIHEGRKRQVRHMTAAVGLPTLRLVRVAIGPLKIDGLEPGQWRDLTADELKALTTLTARSKEAPGGQSRYNRSKPSYENRRRPPGKTR